ncbi:MAG: type sorting protein, partial [Segetibacter sp.]|nr:type sorting protein [Segetibacter sp.]
MKQRFLPIFAFTALLLSSQSYAQRNAAFAVTASSKGNFNWNVIREIDLSTGEVIRTLYDPAINKTINYKAAPGTELKANAIAASATGAGVAAAAYDALHNRLYFTGMRADGLLYFDLMTKDLNVVVNNSPAFNTGSKNDEGNVITRMAFASDGYGYAITNDGKGFIRFTTDQKPSV